MKLPLTPTLLLATLLPALAIAAPKKDFCPEPRKDPREQRESLDRRRLEIHVEQYRRLLIGLEISGIKKSDLDALMQRANSEEHQQIQNIVLTLIHTDGALWGMDYFKRLSALEALKLLLGAEAQPEIHFDPKDPLEARRAAVSDPSLPATGAVVKALRHVFERDSDAGVRRLAEVTLNRIEKIIHDDLTRSFELRRQQVNPGDVVEVLQLDPLPKNFFERWNRSFRIQPDIVIDGKKLMSPQRGISDSTDASPDSQE